MYLLSFFLLLFLSSSLSAFAGGPQDHIIALRSEKDMPLIDGKLTEEFWASQEFAFMGNFTQNTPVNGDPATQKTGIKIIYNDFALYIGAYLYDTDPSKILQEMDVRDSGEKNTDFFAIFLDTYQNKQNAFGFFVSAAGVQTDFFISGGNWDYNWNAVWKSAVSFDSLGWYVEMEIPYAAIRFPNKAEQIWGANFQRGIKRNQEKANWAHIDASIQGTVNQFGQLSGLKAIKPPLRLSVTPYLSLNYAKDEASGSSSRGFGGGMDLKVGLNESFTLDMSLVPDFSQIQSDNQVLNLSPFEVYFNEFRPFFTEGTEIFSKGGLFYSRRVGKSNPSNVSLSANESFLSLPKEAPLVNATKVSGRMNNGLGIGFFNAVTKETYAEVLNNETGATHSVMVDPFTNYNVLVLDQNLKNNSNISFTTTTVMREGQFTDANVKALETSLFDKTNTWSFSANGTISQRYVHNSLIDNPEMQHGFKYWVTGGKVSGKIQFRLSHNVESDTYNPNDLGFLNRNNRSTYSGEFSYNIFQPFWKLLSFSYRTSLRYNMLYNPRYYNNMDIDNSVNFRFKNFWYANFSLGIAPGNMYDYFEARSAGQVFVRQGGSSSLNVSFGSDSRKIVSLSGWYGLWRRFYWNQTDNWSGTYLNLRFSNRFSLNQGFEYSKRRREVGYLIGQEYVDGLEGIYFGKRDVETITTNISAKYTFTNKMGLSIRLRHYWSKVKYYDYYTIDENGYTQDSNYDGLYPTGHERAGEKRHDTDFDAFNIDLVYRWVFAPGSELNFVWKKAIYSSSDVWEANYYNNLVNTMQTPQSNSFSIKVLYFLDYYSVSRALRKK